MRTLPLCLAALIASSSSMVLADDLYLVDQRNPKYQKSFEHLSRVSQALAVATSELEKAQAAYPLPGLDYTRMRDQLRPLEDTISVLLTPEKKRTAHQNLVPDGVFFTPVQGE